jgi:putative endonuclease
MTHFAYIIYSKSLDLYYIGETEFREERLEQHNTNYYAESYSSKANDWEYVWIISIENRSEARKIEAYLKSMKSRKYIQKLVHDSDFKNGFKQYAKDKLGVIIHQVL